MKKKLKNKKKWMNQGQFNKLLKFMFNIPILNLSRFINRNKFP